MERSSSRRRGSGRERRSVGAFSQMPWAPPSNPYAPLDVISADQLEAIHLASLDVLEKIGMDFLHGEAHDILRRAGVAVTPGSNRIRFDRGFIEEAVAKAPAEFVLHARNPAHHVPVGGNRMAICSVGSAPNVSDIEGGRRDGNNRDYEDLLRLTQIFNCIHVLAGYPVEPIDLPPETRHLDCLRSAAVLTDKHFHAYSLGRTRILDGIEIARIARGLSEEQLLREPSLFSVVNTSSPLRLDNPMIEGCIEMARRNQPIAVTPFTLSGAMAPATIAGALVQQNAEALATIAFLQTVNPGTPCFYGGFTSNVDMKSGAPAFGTPEYAKAALAGGQLARRYRIPYRSSNVNASNCVDAQAAYESEMSIWAASLGHANLMMHGAGWLEGGLTASFEKFVLDCELLQMMESFFQPIVVDEDTLGFAAMQDVGPGGHFFGTQHTLDRYETAFYAPVLSDWRNFESWEEAGAEDATRRAHKLYKRLLAEYEPPALDEAVKEELDAFVERRRREGGALAA